MENDLISRSALKETMFQNEPVEQFHPVENREWRKHFQFIEDAPAVDAVSRSFLEQIHWERNLAMEQLRDLDIPFGGNAPDVVKVVRCKDCIKRGNNECPMLFPLVYGYADFTSHNGYCDRGERRVNDGK